jgi:hypothetical protein
MFANGLAVGDGGLIVIFLKNTKAFLFHQISKKGYKARWRPTAC